MKIKFLFPFHNNVLALAKKLSNNHAVTVNSAKPVPRPLIREFISLKQRSIFGHSIYWYPLSSLLQAISREDGVVVLKHLKQPMCLLPALIARLRGVSVVVYQQKISSINFFWRQFLRVFLASNAQAICVLPQEATKLQEVINTTYLPLPINSDEFTKRTPRADNTLKIVMVGKLSQRRKRHTALIAAAQKLSEQGVKLQVTIIGQAGEDNAYKKQLQETAKNASFPVILKQDVAYKQMRKEYAKHDVFVLPATSEPIGFSVLEAMASKLPIICSNEVGASQYLNGNGFVFPAQDVDALSNHLKRFVKNQKRHEQTITSLGTQSLSIVKEKHHPDELSIAFEKVLIR